MIRNGYGAKYIWYEMVSGYGTKLQFCGTKWFLVMVRNCNFVVRNGKLWYELVMVQNTYGTKWFLGMVRNCNFVVRNGKLWCELVMVQNTYGTKWFLGMVRNCNFVVRNGYGTK